MSAEFEKIEILRQQVLDVLDGSGLVKIYDFGCEHFRTVDGMEAFHLCWRGLGSLADRPDNPLRHRGAILQWLDWGGGKHVYRVGGAAGID